MAEAPTKLLQVVESFSTGVFEVVRQICNVAAHSGFDVHVAHGMRPWTPVEFAKSFDPRVTFHRLAWDVRRTPRDMLRSAWQLREIVAQGNYDVVHLHSTFAGLTGSLLASKGRIFIYTPHGYASLMSSLSRPKGAAARTADRWIARRMTLVGGVSPAEGAIASMLGARRVVIIPNGLAEVDAMADMPESGSEIAAKTGVVATGRMSAQRQPRAVADIFRMLPPEVPKAWIGDAADQEAARELVHAGTTLTGWTPRTEVMQLVRRARVYLHWAGWDGHPLSVLEAMVVGTVVIGSDIPPVRDILGKDWVFPDTISAATAISRLLQDDSTYQKAREQQQRLIAPYSGRLMSERWCEVYARKNWETVS